VKGFSLLLADAYAYGCGHVDPINQVIFKIFTPRLYCTKSLCLPILPFSPVGLIVLSIFVIGLAMIIFEVQFVMGSLCALLSLFLSSLTTAMISVAEAIKPGELSLAFVGAFAIIAAVVLNRVMHVDIDFTLGSGLGLVVMYIWVLKTKWCNVETNFDVQLQKVEWAIF